MNQDHVEWHGSHIDDVLPINNPEFLFLHIIHPPEPDIKDTTDTSTPASYLVLLFVHFAKVEN